MGKEGYFWIIVTLVALVFSILRMGIERTLIIFLITTIIFRKGIIAFLKLKQKVVIEWLKKMY